MGSVTPENIERVPCPLCGEDAGKIFIRGSGRRHIVRCQRDGLLYVNPRLSKVRIEESFETFVGDGDEQRFAPRRPALIREANAIKAVKKGGNLLDVGCATGFFFENFTEPGWRLFGVEPCPKAAGDARRRYGAEVSCGNLKQAALPREFFDLVTVLDALYHFADPLAELVETNRILKLDGILA